MPRNLRCLLLAGSAAAVTAGAARAADAPPTPATEIVVTADKAGLLERKPSSTVFGLKKPLIETPRAASFVSDLTLDRYGIQTLDKLTAVSPGTYTASFYGVPGSVQIRGTLAENYFRGFKRIEDRGTYATPIGDAAQINIVRGPPTPLYGPGKIGGLVDFEPKTARDEGRFLSEPTGEVTATLGSYQKKSLTGQVGLPVDLGGVQGGVYAYGELDDSHSFYRGIYPKHQLGEISADFDLGQGWTTAFGGMGYHSTGDVQTPGWNRLTQALIDNQTYFTGRNTYLSDLNHNGRLDPSETNPPNGFYPYTTGLYQGYFGFTPSADPRFALDTGVGTTKLSPRTVFVSAADFSRTGTATYYYDLAKDLGGDRSLKLQLFYDNLSNKRFVSYGFPADYHAWTFESRLVYDFSLDALDGLVTSKDLIGASWRHYKGEQKETYDSGMIALDRRDLSFGPTATDIMASPFEAGSGVGWETDIHSRWDDAGVFATSDITVAKKLNLVLGGRFDNFSATSRDTGVFSFETPATVSAGKGKWTYSASASYQLGWGLMPYATYAQAAALEVEQAGNLRPSVIQANGWVSGSDLSEAGIKFQLLHRTLVGSIAVYRQDRTELSGLNSAIIGTRGKGVEFEARYLATDNLSFTFAGDTQRTEVKGPDHSVVYLPAYTVGVPGAQAYGGAYLTFDFSTLPGRQHDYEDTLVPHTVLSLFGTYTSDRHGWGQAGATLGATYASKTSALVQNAVTYPDYTLVNASAFYKRGAYEVTVNVDNLLDKLYFTPDQDTYANVGALPGRGREWRVTLKRSF
ncbi:TonB-dependent siderophore receptor [Phenylobacterium montanum]|uniref:TonB-dependent receptor n=1 Tax=Phenylobacterium montanum TaxID=2823693 RepID=A0A975ITR6_9CAUL|nr:TonB-dependent receptor [Caulobacter sp. S6]QUD87152.1 TonB-dependent receptor [Caulobacter sp. S6]